MNKTQTVAALTEAINVAYENASKEWSKSDVRIFLETLEEVVVDELGDAEEGTVVIGDIVRIRKVHTPERPAGDYPGFGGEMKHYDKRPASTKLRVTIPKKLKEGLL